MSGSAGSPITTHVLDLARGRPAAGIGVFLRRKEGEGWHAMGNGVTNADGRVESLLPADAALVAGTYELRFATAPYFEEIRIPSFFPEVVVTFTVTDASAHYHVPLLLSPFGYSTYRGS